jgi:hypothetical protein
MISFLHSTHSYLVNICCYVSCQVLAQSSPAEGWGEGACPDADAKTPAEVSKKQLEIAKSLFPYLNKACCGL